MTASTSRPFSFNVLPVSTTSTILSARPIRGASSMDPDSGIIVDVVETGRTLKENGLEVLAVIAQISARLLVNRASYQTKRQDVLGLAHALEKVVQCES